MKKIESSSFSTVFGLLLALSKRLLSKATGGTKSSQKKSERRIPELLGI
jgi:hypothetical protein